MTTARDIITQAHRKIGVVAEDDPMTADQGSNGLFALNAMMHGWLAQGVNYTHTDLALDDAFPLDNRFIEGTVYLLANRIAPDSGVQGPPEGNFLRMLKNHYLVVEEATLPRTVRVMPSQLRSTVIQ